MERLTFYTHYTDLTQLLAQLEKHFGAARLVAGPAEAGFLELTAGPVSAPVLHLRGRQREQPSYYIEAVTDELTSNLAGMYGFVQGLPMADEALKKKLLAKITTINLELTVTAEPAFPPGFGAWLPAVLADYEAFVFSEPNSHYPAATGQGFYDAQGRLLTDTRGQGEAEATVEVIVETKYYDAPTMQPDQLARKARSEAQLQAEGIPFASTLPGVESETTVRVRSREEIVDRALALCYLGLKSEGLEPERLAEFAARYAIAARLSPEETAYAQAAAPTPQQNIDANWRYEGLHVLLWALGYVPALSFPGQMCDVAEDVALVFERSAEELREQATPRTPAELLDAADLIYRYAWACVDARLHQRPAPGGLDASVVHERHYALNWLVGHGDAEWDDVSTDT